MNVSSSSSRGPKSSAELLFVLFKNITISSYQIKLITVRRIVSPSRPSRAHARHTLCAFASRRRVNADRRLKIFVRLSENGSRGPPTAAAAATKCVHRSSWRLRRYTIIIYLPPPTYLSTTTLVVMRLPDALFADMSRCAQPAWKQSTVLQPQSFYSGSNSGGI